MVSKYVIHDPDENIKELDVTIFSAGDAVIQARGSGIRLHLSAYETRRLLQILAKHHPLDALGAIDAEP